MARSIDEFPYKARKRGHDSSSDKQVGEEEGPSAGSQNNMLDALIEKQKALFEMVRGLKAELQGMKAILAGLVGEGAQTTSSAVPQYKVHLAVSVQRIQGNADKDETSE